MKALVQAIYGKFADEVGGDHNALYWALFGGMHHAMAPQRTHFPYATFTLVSAVPEWTFTDDQADVIIQFDIFDHARSPSAIYDAAGHLKALYDRQPLTVSGYTVHWMYCELEQLLREDEDSMWHYMLQFRILMEAN